MRATILLLLAGSVSAQTPAKPPAPVPAPAPAPAAAPATPAKKPPSRLHQVVKKLGDAGARAAAGVVVDTLLGHRGRAIAGAMTGTAPGVTACPPGYAAMAAPGMTGLRPSAGAALVNLTKGTVKKTKPDTSTAAQAAAAA